MSFLYLTALFLIFFALRTQTVRVAQKIKSRLVRYKKSYALRMVECCIKFPVFPIICLAMRKISCTLLCGMVVAVPDAKFSASFVCGKAALSGIKNPMPFRMVKLCVRFLVFFVAEKRRKRAIAKGRSAPLLPMWQFGGHLLGE